jgi:hypothetical protein
MKFSFLESFRARLIALLVILLGLTLGLQYYVNLRAVRRNAQMLVEQEQAIMAGIALGVNSISSRRYMYQMRSDLRGPLMDENTGRVKNVLVVDSDGLIQDSLIDDFAPQKNGDQTVTYTRFQDISHPPLYRAVELTGETENLPPWLTVSGPSRPGEPGAFYSPLETIKGRW